MIQITDIHIPTIREALQVYRDEQWFNDPAASDTSLAQRNQKMTRINAALAALDQAQGQPAIPEPDWANAPEWAMWWAVDPNGYVCWYQEEPILCQTVTYCGWVAKTIKGVQQGNALWGQELDLALGIDWRVLKQRRPEQQPHDGQ